MILDLVKVTKLTVVVAVLGLEAHTTMPGCFYIGVGDRNHELRFVLQASTLPLSHPWPSPLLFCYDNLPSRPAALAS